MPTLKTVTTKKAKVWTEFEIEAKFARGAFDQPKHLGGYNDDDDFTEPFRYLSQWTVHRTTKNKKNGSRSGGKSQQTAAVDLPTDACDLDGCRITGWLHPTTTNNKSIATKPIWVQLEDTRGYCFDRSPEYRGYWIVTHQALYWLHAPRASMPNSNPSLLHTTPPSVRARAVLCAATYWLDRSDLSDDSGGMHWEELVQQDSRGSSSPLNAMALVQLMEQIAPAVALHLVGAREGWTPRCKFIRSLTKVPSSSRITLPDDQLHDICTLVHKHYMPYQLPWGQSVVDANGNDSNLDYAKMVEDGMWTVPDGAEWSEASTKSATESDDDDDDGDGDENDAMSTSPDPPELPTRRRATTTTATSAPVTQSRRGRATKRIVYAEDSDDSVEDSSDDGDDNMKVVSTKPKIKAPARKPPKKKVKRKENSDDDASVDMASVSSDDTLSIDELSESDKEEDVKPATKRKPKAVAKAKSKAAIENDDVSTEKKPEKKKMSDSFQPLNAPSYKRLSLDEIENEKEFLHPCGMESTDDIIDRLVGTQVDKVGSLLQRSIESHKLGSTELPLQLGTACSGTDAPALALTLVKEQLEHRGLGHLFKFSHEFSCEVDPFKQAYLARNFDSVLYPDIAKLADDTPLDVYGREKHIPPFNLFVAGTSCKNFSMLRSTRRIDIEDKGCSGETFLAATEVLYKEKPKMAIFENVIGAPWLKMQEYITGRVKLSECDSKKAIKNIKDGKKELTFVFDKASCCIIVDVVPSVYGVRCGAVVSGFLRKGNGELQSIKWPAQTKKQSCSLSELIKANGIAKKDDTLVFKTECTYCTQITKLDTKDYGLPQTRMRTYMLVWRPENDKVDDDLGKYWEKLVSHLKHPVRHSLQSFILKVDHDIIRVFREALRGPPGQKSMNAMAMEPYFWESANANLPHNKVARERLGLQDEARSTTNWHGFGKKKVPPHYWLEYVKCLNQRSMDLLDILHASAMRDAETHDANFSSFYWNISQNASKEKHKSACPGIAGCVTPGGEFFLPQEGRPILGCEKLLIQGIPYFRLALGNESEVQLGDLAGNAMSLTVVCSTMLAALTCEQLRKETIESKHGDIDRILEHSCLPSNNKLMTWKSPSVTTPLGATPAEELTDSKSFFMSLSDLAHDAVKSSIWCTCETSGSDSLTSLFLQCKVCRVSCCRNCVSAHAGYNLESHDTREIAVVDRGVSAFRSKLLCIAANKSFIFNESSIKEMLSLGEKEDPLRVSVLSSYTFRFHDVRRDRQKWCIIFYARDAVNHEPMAEFRIVIGVLDGKASDDGKLNLGLKGELTSFLPAKTAPLVYGALNPCAAVTVKYGTEEVEWVVYGGASKASLVVKGKSAEDSPRVEIGLTDEAAKSLIATTRKGENKNPFGGAVTRNETRRWMYPKNWKHWPKSIDVAVDDSAHSDLNENIKLEIDGTYRRSACRQTKNLSALWIKDEDATMMPTYILIRPNVNRTGPDRAIISRSMNHEDKRSVLAVLPRDWQPCDALDPDRHNVQSVELLKWRPMKNMSCLTLLSAVAVDMRHDATTESTRLTVSGLGDEDIQQLCYQNLQKETRFQLNVVGGQKSQQIIRAFNRACVAPILQFASSGKFMTQVRPDSAWISLCAPRGTVPFGCCNITNPARPSEQWSFDKDRKAWTRTSEPGASRKYYKQLQDAPQPFEFWLDKIQKNLTVAINPSVAAHHASHQLIQGRGVENMHEEIDVCYRLSDTSQQSDPVLSPFKVRNSDEENTIAVELKPPYALYERQQKVVSKMLNIENSSTLFDELEISEHGMPGSTGLSLVARATRSRALRGGVVCDAIGSGKTVVSIAIILNGLHEARQLRKQSNALSNKTGASLVVMPPALIGQWESEIEKFSGDLTVINIYDDKSFSNHTVEDFKNADVVLCPIDILEAKGYLARVLSYTGIAAENVPTLPPYSGQLEQSGAHGVWIPSSSADPYGGTNNPLNQKRRNQSAYFTQVYLDAIQEIRRQRFEDSAHAPLEYFEFERVFCDEIHESLCTTKGEIAKAREKDGFFTEKNRRAGRELLGITQKDISKRPLIFRKGIFGLTGTPLLDSSSRVTELANLMGGIYVCGLSSHWRRLERESTRDIFLCNYLEPKQSREIRKTINAKCQDYIDVACCRNKMGDEMNGIQLVNNRVTVNMTQEEKELYLKSQSGIQSSMQSLAITPEEFDVTAGHNIYKFLHQNVCLASRGKKLVTVCESILAQKGCETTKIVVFTDGRVGAGKAAQAFLNDAGLGCTFLELEDSVEERNRKISWYQTGDATEEDRNRPRVLVLHFEHAAGLNLQSECHNLILFSPLYVGEGGSTSDPVSDASTELQAIGRVYRAGQMNPQVYVWRIEVSGPEGEDALDSLLIGRNTNPDNLAMAVNAGEN